MQEPGLHLTAKQTDEHGLTRCRAGDRISEQVYRATQWQLRRPTGKWGFVVHDLREKSIDIIRRYQSANGAYVACPNFDQYRYCWLRDGSFIAYAMDRSGAHQSARSFYKWVHGVIESPRILVTSVVSKRRHMLHKNYQNSLQLLVPIHTCVILSRGGRIGTSSMWARVCLLNSISYCVVCKVSQEDNNACG